MSARAGDHRSKQASLEDLKHDVGKYLTRTARNLPAEAPDALRLRLLPLLVADLYGADSSGDDNPRKRFRLLAKHSPLEASLIAAIDDHFETISQLEAKVRAGERAAITEACEVALSINQLLHETSQ